jgi:hypothetical protein
MLKIRFGGSRGNREIGGCDERKEHDEAEEGECEEEVDSKGTDKEDEASKHPVTVSYRNTKGSKSFSLRSNIHGNVVEALG